MMKLESLGRVGILSSVVAAAALWLAACSGSSSGLNGAGGSTGALDTGGSSGILIGSGGAVASGAGGMMMGAGGVMMGVGGAGGAGGASTGASCHAPGTLQVTNSGMAAYVIDGVSNPDLTFCRASTYVFAVSTPGHPFYINSVQGIGTSHAYGSGVTGNGATSGDVTFVVPSDAPDTLFYNCSIHASMTGMIHIVD